MNDKSKLGLATLTIACALFGNTAFALEAKQSVAVTAQVAPSGVKQTSAVNATSTASTSTANKPATTTPVKESSSAATSSTSSTTTATKPSAVTPAASTPTKNDTSVLNTSSTAANSGSKPSAAAVATSTTLPAKGEGALATAPVAGPGSIPDAKIIRVAISLATNSVQIYFSEPVEVGECSYNFKVAAPYDTLAAQGMLMLAQSAQLNAQTVQVSYDNQKENCVAGAPGLTFLKVID